MVLDSYKYDPIKGVVYGKHGKELGNFTRKYVRLYTDGKTYKRSRVAYYLMKGSWPVGEMDHINGDCHDDRWENLRECSREENAKNRRVYKNNTTGFKGVYPMTHKGRTYRYGAKIQNGGKGTYIGCYKTPEDAARAYDVKCLELHGEFADINFK